MLWRLNIFYLNHGVDGICLCPILQLRFTLVCSFSARKIHQGFILHSKIDNWHTSTWKYIWDLFHKIYTLIQLQYNCQMTIYSPQSPNFILSILIQFKILKSCFLAMDFQTFLNFHNFWQISEEIRMLNKKDMMPVNWIARSPWMHCQTDPGREFHIFGERKTF